MKLISVAAIVLFISAPSYGGPTERVIMAAMKLSEKDSYSWTSTVEDDAGSYDITGKTQGGGYTWVRLPMVKSIAQRLGREADNDIEAFFKGTTAFVLRTERGWQLLRELPKKRRDFYDDIDIWPAPMPPVGRGPSAIAATDPFGLPPIVLHRAPDPDEDRRPYSNAQCALSLPHQELAVIVSSHTDLRIEGDIVTGVLSDLGAQLLLVRDGQEQINPLLAAGTFKLQIVDGMVTKYFVRLEGIMQVDRKKVHVRQTSSTVIKDIGTTSFVVPDEVRKKLEP